MQFSAVVVACMVVGVAVESSGLSVETQAKCLGQITVDDALDWSDTMEFVNGHLTTAPLAFACFVQCAYATDGQTDQTTGLPSSKATKNNKVLAEALKKCDTKSNLPAPKIINSEGPSADVAEKCIKSLSIDMCMLKNLIPPVLEETAYKQFIETHDCYINAANEEAKAACIKPTAAGSIALD